MPATRIPMTVITNAAGVLTSIMLPVTPTERRAIEWALVPMSEGGVQEEGGYTDADLPVSCGAFVTFPVQDPIRARAAFLDLRYRVVEQLGDMAGQEQRLFGMRPTDYARECKTIKRLATKLLAVAQELSAGGRNP